MRRTLVLGLTAVAALTWLAAVPVTPAVAQTCPMQVTEAHCTVTLEDCVYDPVTDTTTFTYRVNVSDDPALSHWIVGFAALCAPDLVSCSPEPCHFQDPDPTTGVTGVKFDDLGVGPGGIQWFSFTVRGDGTQTIQLTEIALKAGQQVMNEWMCGPSCPVPVELMQFWVESGFTEETSSETEG